MIWAVRLIVAKRIERGNRHAVVRNTNLARLRYSGTNAVIAPEMDSFAKTYGFQFNCHAIILDFGCDFATLGDSLFEREGTGVSEPRMETNRHE